MAKSPHNTLLFRTLSVLSPLTLLLVWELLARIHAIDTRLFSSPSLIVQAFAPLALSGELILNTLVSVQRVVLGFVAGAAPGIILGMSMGLSPFVRSAVEPMIAAISAHLVWEFSASSLGKNHFANLVRKWFFINYYTVL